MTQRRSRAGRTGGSLYGAHEVRYLVNGHVQKVDITNLQRAKSYARNLVKRGETTRAEVWSEIFEGGELQWKFQIGYPRSAEKLPEK